MTDTTSQEFFDRKYREHPDPWNFASSSYEQGRYEAIYSALSHRHFRRAFEPGCSIGSLTERLAPLCDSLEAIDISPTAVEFARERCRHFLQAHFAQGSLPDAIPPGSFDLIVLSEIGYYFKEAQLLHLGNELVKRLENGGILLATHWLGHSEDHLLSGDRVHQILSSLSGLTHEQEQRHENFRLDRWCR